MMRLLALPTALSLLSYVLAVPTSHTATEPLPLLIWHGLGDRYDNDGLQSAGDLAEEVYPGTYVHYIRIDDDGSEDQKATFFGNVTEHIAQVCEAIKEDEKLVTRDSRTGEKVVRADALGFSQGGQFLRGLLQRCDGLSIRSLVTFGSQHNGIAEIKACGTWDLLCKGALALMKGNAWSDYVQGRVVPAQYYRTLNESTGLGSEEYLEHSNLLADINNEKELKNEVYKKRLAGLEKFVMFLFEEDTTVIPKESGWFAEVNATSGDVTPLRERPIYKEDWLGLKELDEQEGLVFLTTHGDHMQLSDRVLRETYKQYFGPERKSVVTAAICGHGEADQWWPIQVWKHKAEIWEGLKQEWALSKHDL